ncbi:hypothetical protein [Sporisorium scitamineum]|uniref:DUF4048 domain-containing protein n=1 Tax=Sporisorium scitamineum TaxID=49012 RepID=A0A0F7RWB9_9BASI|nr:hypothetical protein [Sporisorium scitamineum]
MPPQHGHRPTSRRTLSLSSDDSSTSRDLLRLIAEKERRCFELREELSSEEATLKQLRSAWQRMATKELAYSTPATSHRRDGSTASNTSDVATDAWNSFSSKLPGSFKTQLNNLNTLLESIANPEVAPEPVEKQASLGKAALSGGEENGMLRPTGGGLSVLEEEGSDVGSAALSPRSPRSPAVGMELPHSDSTSPNTTLVPRSSSQLVALAQQDSQALGFTVDANGIAHPTLAIDEVGPPTPPKPPTARNSSGGNAWTRPTSVLGSLSTLQSKLAPTTDSSATDEAGSGGGGFASMFAKRLKEARSNASDLLREAERKLGNAMTIDDLLGVTTTSPHPSQPRSPQITLDEASVDSSYAPSPSPWYEAAGGAPRRSSERKLSPATEEMGRRVSSSSSRSSSGSLNAPPARVGSPHGSAVIGGAPGAAGVFGMLLGSQTELGGRRQSGSANGWGWGGKDDEDDEGWGG